MAEVQKMQEQFSASAPTSLPATVHFGKMPFTTAKVLFKERSR